MLLAPIARLCMWKHPIIRDHMFFTQGDSIAIGCFLAVLMDRRKSELLKVFQFYPNICRLFAFGVTYSNLFVAHLLSRLEVRIPNRLWGPFIPSLQCVSVCYLIGSLVMVRSGLGYWLMNCAPVRWVGRLSYSLYIWQQLLLIPAVVAIVPDSWKAVMWTVRFPQNLVFVFVFAMLSYYCLEQPVLKLKARFAKVESVG